MRSNVDGKNRTTVVTENLYEPVSIAVDHTMGKLYWIDDEEGIHYKLEQSSLDGNDRSILVHGKHQQPVHLAVDRSSVYWTDFVYSAVWEISKDVQAGDVPQNFRSYFDPNRQADPTSILARDNVGSAVNCKGMREAVVKRKPTTLAAPQPTAQSFNNLTTSTEEGEDQEEKCFNGGAVDKASAACKCKPG